MRPGEIHHYSETLRSCHALPRRRWKPTLLRVVLAAALAAASFLAGAQRGAMLESRRGAPVELRYEQAKVVQGRGDLWLRCPSSGTWYNYAGDRREWLLASEVR